MLLHGLGASSRYWERLAEASWGYAATAPDLLGFGRSPKPPGTSYDLACYVEALAPLLSRGSVVVGHSTGAILAAASPWPIPERCEACCCWGCRPMPTRPSPGGRSAAWACSPGSPCRAIRWPGPCAWPCADCDFSPPRSLPWSCATFLPPSPPTVPSTHGSYSRTLERVVLAHPVVHHLGSVSVPVILLHGDSDRPAPLRYARTLAAELRAAGVPVDLHVVAGDHHLGVRRPAVTAGALNELLDAYFSAPE